MSRRNPLATTLLAATAIVALASLAAQAASPTLSRISPRGGQRGTDVQVSFTGGRLADAQEIVFHSPGFEVVKLEAKADNRVDVTLKILPECRLGEHAMRVRTASGISDLMTFYVGALPEVAEDEPNNEFAEPQPIEKNVTVTGVVQSEDVDYFAVQAKKGERISVEVEGMRLATTLFDPYVAILDSKRFELAAADDTPLVYQDAVAQIVAPEDGTYVIEVRESAYGGNGASLYRVHVGNFPRPTAVYPAGGKIGEKVDVKYLGDVAGEFTQSIQLPSQVQDDFGLVAQDAHGLAPSENPFRLFEHGNALEQEPNNAVAEATPAELPNAFNGIIAEAGDIDHFKFAAKKGQSFEVHCYARRIRSPLDAVMSVHQADGRQLAANDDTGGPDAYFRFNVPADGEYVLRIRDHLGRGGVDFVYRVEFTTPQPEVTFSIPQVRRYSQERQSIAVPQGNRYATLMSVRRSGVGGDLNLHADKLPQGITIHGADPLPGGGVVPVLFEAAADAPVGGSLVDVTARKVDDPEAAVPGGFAVTAQLVRGNPGQSIYWSKTVERLAVVVAEKVPFKLEIVEPKVPVVRNGSMQLKVVAHREEGFTKPIRVEFPYRPPGIGAASAVTIPEGQNEVLYPLNANGNAALGKHLVVVHGTADAGSGPIWISSQLATLEVAEPYVQFALQRAACEQGQPAQIACEVTQATPFEGAAQVKLLGLPNKVTAADLELTKDTKELIFQVATDPASPPGQHKNIFCQVVITQNGEPITHRLGTTELRIDKPLPKPTKEPEPKTVAAKEPPKEEKPATKPLSRLEQLRLEAAKRKAEAANKTESDAAGE